MKRVLGVLLGALLLALALSASTVLFLAASEGGTRLLARQAERFLPVRFEGVSGALLREIQVSRVTLELDARTVVIDELAVALRVVPLLFEDELVVESARAASVVVTQPADAVATGSPPAIELPFIPIGLELGWLELGRLELPGVFPMVVTGSALWDGDGLHVRSLQVSGGPLALAAEGSIGHGRNPAVELRAAWSLPERQWGGEGRLYGRVDALRVEHTLRGAVAVRAQGTVNLADVGEPAVDLDVEMADLDIGATGLSGLGAHLTGTPANLLADATARVAAGDIEPFTVEVQAYGPPLGPLTVRNLRADALGGTQEAQGTVAWDDDLRVQLGGLVRRVSLAGFRDGVDGRVDAAVQFDYRDGLVALIVDDLTGTLSGRSLAGHLEITQIAGGWDVNPLRLRVADNAVSGNARIQNDDIALEVAVDAPALGGLLAGFTGDARGRVRLSGRWPDLSGSAALSSERLSGFDASVETATVQAELEQGRFTANARAARVVRQQLAVEDAALRAEGTFDDLAWETSWDGGSADGRLARKGQALEVALDQAHMTVLEQNWGLTEPARIDLADGHVSLTPVCAAGGGASVCVQRFVYSGGEVETRGLLQRAPLALLRPWLPVRFDDPAYVEGGWRLSGPLDDLSGDLTLAARSLAFVPEGGEDPIELPDVEAAGTLQGGALDLRLSATGAQFELAGSGRLAALTGSGELSGRITADATDLAPLKVFDQRIDELGGTLRGELRVGGTVALPQLTGEVRLADGKLKLTDPDLRLTAINVVGELDDSGAFEVHGSARQKKADVTVGASGHGLFDGNLVVDASLKGDKLRAEHPDWEVDVSPDLTFSYADGGGVLRGRVEVPHAEVRLTTLPRSVPSPSEDVVVVGRDEAVSATRNRIRMNVELVLGDDVALKALGITAELEGSVRARLGAEGRPSLHGTLDVTGGVLSAQGQTLAIESGSVVYNGPINRPYINVRAVRVIGDVSPEVKVGLQIRGDADSLTSSVFSDPVMSDTRALSFLVLGRDIEEDTADTDGNRLMAAAINLGLSRSKGITSELMRLAGLDELSASAESQDSFDIIAGKRVTDDLYVRYTYNTLSAMSAFLVRFDLSKRWQLEAESGEQSSMDILYHLRK